MYVHGVYNVFETPTQYFITFLLDITTTLIFHSNDAKNRRSDPEGYYTTKKEQRLVIDAG